MIESANMFAAAKVYGKKGGRRFLSKISLRIERQTDAGASALAPAPLPTEANIISACAAPNHSSSSSSHTLSLSSEKKEEEENDAAKEARENWGTTATIQHSRTSLAYS